MNNVIQFFDSEHFGNTRAVMLDGEPWLVATDIARTLGYANASDAIARHVDPEDRQVAVCQTRGGKQKMIVINESGFYSLVMGSALPTARNFKRWITHEVLPLIRKHGVYVKPVTIDDLLADIDGTIAIMQEIKREQEAAKSKNITPLLVTGAGS